MWPRRPTTRSQIPKTRRPTIRIREIVEADDPALTRAYELLSTSFLREERVTLDTWHASLAERSAGLLTDIAWHLFVAEQDEDVVGLASGTYLGNAASCSRTRAISSSSRSSEGRRRAGGFLYPVPAEAREISSIREASATVPESELPWPGRAS